MTWLIPCVFGLAGVALGLFTDSPWAGGFCAGMGWMGVLATTHVARHQRP